jgi:Domain of unknown function (DUF4397)
MRHTVRPSGMRGYFALAAMMVAMAVVMIAAPISLQSASAQSTTIQTRVQFLHAGSNVGKVEIKLNGDTKVNDFSYGDTSDWIDVDPGSVELQIEEDRRGINYNIFYAVYPVPAGNDYHIIISDQLILASVVDRSPITDGSARVRVTQASIDVPAVNVIATGTDVNFATQLNYPRSSDYVSVPAGTYDLAVNIADSGQQLLAVPGVTFESNMVYDIVVMGDPSDTDHPVSLTTLSDTTAAGTGAATPIATPLATPSS